MTAPVATAPETATMTLAEFHALYDQALPKYDPEKNPDKYNGYAQLVNSLEEVFRAAGYVITGKELAGEHHSRIVCAIGLPTLPEIANHFIGWVSLDSLDKYLRNFPDYGYSGGYRDWRLPAYTLTGWNEFLKAQKKGRGIGNKGAKYDAFISEMAAMPQVWASMTAEAQKVVDSYDQEMSRKKAESDERNQRKLDGIAHLRRTAEIIDAFVAIAGVDDKGRAEGLRQLAAAVEEYVSVRWFTYRTLSTEEVLADSMAWLKAGSNKLTVLFDLWRAMYPLKLVEFINSANAGRPYRIRDVQSVGDCLVYALTQSDDAVIPPLETLENYANERRGRYGGLADENGHRVDQVRVYGNDFVVVIKANDDHALFDPKADAMAVLKLSDNEVL